MGYMEFLRGIDGMLVAGQAPSDKSTDCIVGFPSAATVLGR